MQIKNGIVNGTLRVLGKLKAEDIFGDLTGNASSASSLLDSGDSTQLTMKRSAASLSNPTYLAGWNGNELRTVERTAVTVGYATDAYNIKQNNTSSVVLAPGDGKIGFQYHVNNGTTGLFPNFNNANSIITINKHEGNYYSQLGFSNNGEIYYRNFNGAALNTTTGWVKIVTDANISTVIDDTYVNVAGDTMTGVLHLLPNQYTDSLTSGALDLGNSNIYGVNSIYMADLADNSAEGIHFYRDSTHTDSLWAKSGTLYFSPNRTVGSAAASTDYTILHSNNYSSYALPLTGGTLSGLLYINRGSTNAPSIKWNKAGSHWGGIGYHGVSNENYFGPVDINGAWVEADATDTWTFRGYLKSTARATFPGVSIGGYNNTTYALSTNSLICNSWIRTVGSTGWYNESYGGGWYMTDSTWVRVYNGKKVYINNTAADALKVEGGITASSTVTAAGFKHSSYLNDNYLITANGGATKKSTLSYLGSGSYVTITVDGDANTYYPVIINGVSSHYPLQLVNISRSYYDTAPDTWNTSTHKGGLTLTLLWNGSRYWDGNGAGSACHCVYLYQSYSTMVGGFGNSTSGKVVWLRGGGAVYYLHSMNGAAATATVHLSTFTDSANLSFAPKTTADSITVGWPKALEATNADTLDGYHHDAFVKRAGDTMSGALNFTENKKAIEFRPNGSSWYTHVSYQTSGNEALVFGTKNTVTSFIFANGEDPANISSTRWTSITPGLQIKNNCVSIGALWGSDVTPDYKFKVTGTSYFSDLITTSTGSGKGIKIGSTYLTAISGNLILQSNTAIRFGDSSSWDYNVWAGLKYVSASKAVYLGLADNSAFTANAAQTDGKLYIVNCHVLPTVNNSYDLGGSSNYWSRVHSRWIHANRGNSSTDGGVTLYDTSASYAILSRSTSNSGTHGYVTGDWATYFTMSDTNNRGWIFRRYGSKNVASINTDGKAAFNGDVAIKNGSTTPVNFSTTSEYVRKNVSWNSSSYLENVILLVPVLTASNWSGHNFVDGKFLCRKTGGNVYDEVEVGLNCVYNCLEYYIQSHGQHTGWDLCRCTYGGVNYYAIKCPYHANPYTHVEFIGNIVSELTGGTNTVALPLAVAYYNRNTSSAVNTEVNNSISTTLTTSIVTSVIKRKLKVDIEGTATAVRDASNSTTTYLNYGASGITNPAWYAAWNGYELRAISPLEVRKGISALGAVSDGSYYGITEPDGTTSNWIRTTAAGLIPQVSGGNSSSLGTSGWPFVNIYATNHYGTNFDGSTTGVFKGHQLILQGTTNATMTSASTNPRITFQGGTGTQPVHLIYTDYDSYRAPAGLKVIGNEAGAWFEVDGRLFSAGASIGGYNNTSYALSTASFICSSWIRTKGSTGWYNEDYGGGWYMTDSTWIRSYGSKQVYINHSAADALRVQGGITAVDSAMTAVGFKHSSYLDNNYLLTANGGALHRNGLYNYYLAYNGQWNGSDTTKNVDSATGMVFSYTTHGAPNSWGTTVTFEYSYNSSYRFQMHSTGYNNALYYRNKSSDRGGWTSWARIIDSENIGSQSVSNSDMLDGYHHDSFVKRAGDTMTGNITLGSYGMLGFGDTIPATHKEVTSFTPEENAVWLATTGGGSESAGICIDGATIRFWTPNDRAIEFLDSDTAAGTVYASVKFGTVTGGTWNGSTIGVAYGGTGVTSWTANRVLYASAATTLSYTSHYVSSTKMAINSTTEPSYNFYVSGSSRFYGEVTITGTLTLTKTTDASATANNSPALIIGGAATAAHIEIDNNEIIAKSNGTTQTTLYIQDTNGVTTFGGRVNAPSFNATSDMRLKTNLRSFKHGDIFDLPVYKFDFIDGEKDKIGCLAQDLQQICPEIVHQGEDGYLSIEESKIVYLLLDKMKEMQAEINALKEGK